FFINTYENTNIFNAIGRSLSLMHLRRENFWGALFANAICFFVYMVLSMNFILPLTLLMQAAKYIGGATEEFFSNGVFGIIILIGTLLATFLQLFFLNIPLIGIAVKYFDWVERVDGRGLIER